MIETWSNFPTWGAIAFVIFSIVLGTALVSDRNARIRRRVLLATLVVFGGVIIAATGPLCQSILSNMIDYGTSGILLVFHGSDRSTLISLFGQSFKWGSIPGSFVAVAVIAARGWRRKLAGGVISAPLAFTAMDAWEVFHSHLNSDYPDLGYLINSNIAGGLFAGFLVSSWCSALEGRLAPGPSTELLDSSRRLRQIAIASLAAAAPGIYISWYFFFDQPPAAVSLNIKAWSSLTASGLGESLEQSPPNALQLSATTSWTRLSISQGERVLVRPLSLSASGFVVKKIDGTFFDPQRLQAYEKIFKKIRPIYTTTGSEGVYVYDDVGVAMAPADRKTNSVSLLASIAGANLISLSKPSASSTEAEECAVSFSSAEIGSIAKGRVRASGSLAIYLQPKQGPTGHPLNFEVVSDTEDGSGSKPIYKGGALDSLIQILPKSGELAVETSLESFSIAGCNSLLKSLGQLDWLIVDAEGGDLKVGIDHHDLGRGDHLLLGLGFLNPHTEGSTLIADGLIKKVTLNKVDLNKTRWERMSVEVRATLVAALLGALGAAIGFMVHGKARD